MKRVSLLGAALLFAASAQAFAQQKDTRGKVTLPMPPARTPAVADAAQSRRRGRGEEAHRAGRRRERRRRATA